MNKAAMIRLASLLGQIFALH